MNSSFKKCLDSLNDNVIEIRSDAIRILSRLCDNIISFPNDNEYRRIRVDDPRIADKFLKANGAIECLFEMGFVEDGEYFLLPAAASLSRLRRMQKALRVLRTKMQAITTSDEMYQGDKGIKMNRMNKFLDHIVDKFEHILIYENPELQNKALRVIPLERLQIGAVKRMRQLQKELKLNKSIETANQRMEHQVTMEDFLLIELLDWFKNEFFTWMDSPNCDMCGNACTYNRVELSTDSRIFRTEIHRCEDCGIETKFARYTNPGILLKTRRGRCGEWANAFALLCRTLGFDTRLVHDETDHVWTEVWSIASNRWIHADPCENTMDRPLLYERGWKKKLTYVIAYSRDEVQDVTWRYTRDQAAVIKRRMLCTENDLCSLICKLNNKRQNTLGYSEARKRFVTKRRALELVEFLSAPPGVKKPGEENDGEYEGRTSGSLVWRTSRGETQPALFFVPQQTSIEPRIWKMPQNSGSFEIRYYSARDVYEMLTNDGKIVETRTGWQNGVWTIEGGMFRKIEKDWKIVYLSRSPGEAIGRIAWCFEILESAQFVKKFELRAKCTSFQNGTIEWKVEGTSRESEKPHVVVSIDNCENFQTEALNGSSKITMVAELGGGKGDLAWQHAQVFRQSLRDRDEPSMIISIETCRREK